MTLSSKHLELFEMFSQIVREDPCELSSAKKA